MAESGHTLAMLTLAITGFDADPNAVTEVLGLEPTRVGRKGEPLPNGRPRTFNGWWHGVGQHLTDGKQHDDALTGILPLLQGREHRFATLRTSIRPKQLTIYGGLHVPCDGQCGVWLEPDQMQLLAACGVGWSLDLFTQN